MKDNTKTSNKKNYKTTNWKEYNDALVTRGSITVWLSDEAIASWNSPVQSGKAGHPKTYSDLAIQTALSIQAVYHLPLRATEGFVQSLLFMMGLAHLKSPDYSTLSYRSKDLNIPMSAAVRKALSSGESLHVAVDSTGVKIYGEGEWKVRKHGWTKRRTWRKVHLGVDVSTHLIPTHETTDQNTADSHVVPDLLEQANTVSDTSEVGTLYADGAYDTWDMHDLCIDKNITLIAPPRANARDQYWQPDEPQYRRSQTYRNKIVRTVEREGMEHWKQVSGYHKRSLSETAMYRFKAILGNTLSARTEDRQGTQVSIRIAVLNTMTLLGMPRTVEVT